MSAERDELRRLIDLIPEEKLEFVLNLVREYLAAESDA